MSHRERDRLRVLHSVLEGQRFQVEAARLLRLGTRQLRRLLQRLQQGGDAALVNGLPGQPSNRRKSAKPRRRALQLHRKDYPDFGPTFAAEKQTERGVDLSPDTLRRWLLAEGLWQPKRRRDQHRGRRPRHACFGELVQMDTSIHDWTEGQGEDMVLLHTIDDAASRLLDRFHDADTILNHMDLPRRLLQGFGRPLALYTERHSIFEPQDEGQALPDVETREAGDAHRAVETTFNVAAILSLQQQRTAANDYTVRLENRHYQVDKPINPEERGGKVAIELCLDGSMAIRFGEHYLKHHEIVATTALGALPPQNPEV